MIAFLENHPAVTALRSGKSTIINAPLPCVNVGVLSWIRAEHEDSSTEPIFSPVFFVREIRQSFQPVERTPKFLSF